jgi:anti-anti-sigma regulatory factor
MARFSSRFQTCRGLSGDTADMLSSQASASTSSVVVDLIGDLDATLGALVTDTFRELVADGTRTVWLSTKYIATTSRDGIAALAASLHAARARGLEISLDGGTDTMRRALEGASIVYSSDFIAPPERARHYMFAHHEVEKRGRGRPAAGRAK